MGHNGGLRPYLSKRAEVYTDIATSEILRARVL